MTSGLKDGVGQESFTLFCKDEGAMFTQDDECSEAFTFWVKTALFRSKGGHAVESAEDGKLNSLCANELSSCQTWPRGSLFGHVCPSESLQIQIGRLVQNENNKDTDTDKTKRTLLPK
ncbi:hypothetical protein A6R68_17448 [Neotoma lepida]|uniref:Uncharacterized protein n=1 Tax=Neotoma lepida TaxID=56216 RepID=A0A1A6HEN4_NEOLE|nr:hypothetical protein A6R68_17448 [Neotoma lepida]